MHSYRKRNTRYPHVCEVCGKSYVSSRWRQRFCSRECTGKAHAITHVGDKQCAYCGEAFSGNKTKKYCTKACAYAAKLLRQAAAKKAAARKPKTTTPRYGFWGI